MSEAVDKAKFTIALVIVVELTFILVFVLGLLAFGSVLGLVILVPSVGSSVASIRSQNSTNSILTV